LRARERERESACVCAHLPVRVHVVCACGCVCALACLLEHVVIFAQAFAVQASRLDPPFLASFLKMNAIAFILLVAAPTAASAAADAAVFPVTVWTDAQCTTAFGVGINGVIFLRTGTCFDTGGGKYALYECSGDKEVAVTEYSDDTCTTVSSAKKTDFKFAAELTTCTKSARFPTYLTASASCGTTMSCTTDASVAKEDGGWTKDTTCTAKAKGTASGASGHFVPLSVVGVIVAMLFA
jgi:hypothetical protein